MFCTICAIISPRWIQCDTKSREYLLQPNNREATHCFANGILLRHASLATVGCEALRTNVSRILWDGNGIVRKRYDC